MASPVCRVASACGAAGLLLIVQAYRNLFPRMMLSTCRFQPTCSQYALEALHHHDLQGLAPVLGRLIRCCAWRGSGYDPTP